MTDTVTMTGREAGTALSQLEGLRDRLAAADPMFEAAAQLEHKAEAFCDRIRADLKDYRIAQGLNQSALAERIDLSQSAISKLENGHGDLSVKTVFRIAAALGLNPVVAFASAAHPVEDLPVPPAESPATAAALAAVVQEDLIRQIPEIVQTAAARLAASE